MKPRQPDKLGPHGRKLWRSVVDVYELRPDEVRVLEQAARTVDLVEAMHQALTDSGLTATGSMGQVRPDPLLSEIRGHRALLAQLLKQLGLPDEEDPARQSASTSAKAMTAARARWGSPRGA